VLEDSTVSLPISNETGVTAEAVDRLEVDCSDLVSYDAFLAGYGFRAEGVSGGDVTAGGDVVATHIGFGTVAVGAGAYPMRVSISLRRVADSATPFQATVQAFCCRSTALE
jgi:hypothetical protein